MEKRREAVEAREDTSEENEETDVDLSCQNDNVIREMDEENAVSVSAAAFENMCLNCLNGCFLTEEEKRLIAEIKGPLDTQQMVEFVSAGVVGNLLSEQSSEQKELPYTQRLAMLVITLNSAK